MLLDDILETLDSCALHEAVSKQTKSWLSPLDELSVYVNNLNKYYELINDLYCCNKAVQAEFSKLTFVNELEKVIVKQKKSREPFPDRSWEAFVKTLFETYPQRNVSVFCPISGVTLKKTESLDIGPYTVALKGTGVYFLADDKCLHIGINNIKMRDIERVNELATSLFDDFCRMVHFMIGRFDNRHIVKIGFPLLHISGDTIYTGTDAYTVVENETPCSASFRSRNYNAIDIDNDFFVGNQAFTELWNLKKRKHEHKKLSLMQQRILNAAILVGESARTTDINNAIIYSCIATESLFSYFDKGAAFGPSIGERISEAIAFVAGVDVEDRIKIQQHVKNVYELRSAIVHGGEATLNSKHVLLNHYTRNCIAKLLTDELYVKVKTIEDFYALIKRMKFS